MADHLSGSLNIWFVNHNFTVISICKPFCSASVSIVPLNMCVQCVRWRACRKAWHNDANKPAHPVYAALTISCMCDINPVWHESAQTSPQSHAGYHSLVARVIIHEFNVINAGTHITGFGTQPPSYLSANTMKLCCGRTWTQMQTFVHGKINFASAALFAS